MKKITSTEALNTYFEIFITPNDLAWEIDEIIHEYYLMSTRLLQIEVDTAYLLSIDINSRLHLLKELRDALLKCKEEE